MGLDLDLLLDFVHDAIIIINDRLTILSWNREAAILFGWSSDEVVDHPFQEIFPDVADQADDQNLLDFLISWQPGKQYETEWTATNRVKNRLWIRTRGMVFADKGKPRKILLACQDITYAHLAGEENERNRIVLETIFAANPSGMAVVSGPYLTIQLANDAFRAISPHPEIDPLGRMLEEIWPAGKDGIRVDIIRQALTEDASVTVDIINQSIPDQAGRTFTMHTCPMDWSGEKSVLLVIWETTSMNQALQEARRMAEEAMEGRRILDTLLEYNPEGVIIASAPDAKITHISKYNIGLMQQGEVFSETNDPRDSLSQEVFRPDGITPLHPADLPMNRAISHGEVIENEEILLRRGGQNIHLMVNAGPIRDEQGNITGAISTARDITERTRAEMNQRFLSELGRALVALRSPEDLMGGIAYRTGRYLEVDRCFLSHEDLELGQSVIHDDFHPGQFSLSGIASLGRISPEIVEHLSMGRPFIVNDLNQDTLIDQETRGTLEALQFQAFATIPWLDREGIWAGTLTVASNKPRTWRVDELALLHSIADLVRLALENATLFQDLREFRHRFEVALRNAPIAVFSMDRDLRCSWIFNPGDIFTNEEILGQPLDLLLMSGEGAELVKVMRHVLSLGEGIRQEIRIPIQDEDMILDLTVEPLRDDEGQVVGLTCAAMEITAQRRMEAEAVLNLAHIEVQHRLIQEREQERTRIARDLHDGPLQDLIATNFTLVEAMDITEKDTRLEKLREIQDSIHHQIDELRRFCNDLRPPVLGSFGLGKTIRAHLAVVQERNPDLVIHQDLDSDQRSLPEEVRMTLFQAFQELMNNVIRHSQAKNVTVHFHMEESHAILEIEDDGIGFDTPLSWVDLAREGHLGLVGLRERVEMTGGRVEMSAIPGEGTAVRIIVPRHSDEGQNLKVSSQGEI